MIVQLIEKQFPVYQYQEQTDPVTGNVVRVRVLRCRRQSRNQSRESRRQQELLDKVADLDFPQNPMDATFLAFRRRNRSGNQWPHVIASRVAGTRVASSTVSRIDS